MVYTQLRSADELLKELSPQDTVTLVGCDSCARVAGSGSIQSMQELAIELRNRGINVVDGYTINMVCTPHSLALRFQAKNPVIISMSCGAGMNNLKSLYPNAKVISASKDIGLMMVDTTRQILKVSMPFKTNDPEEHREYETLSGNPLCANNTMWEECKHDHITEEHVLSGIKE